MNIQKTKGDITEQNVEVIVNAWNQNFIPYWMLLSHGVSKAIKKKAGTKPFKEVQRHGLLPLGGAVLTTAGKLPLKGIIHVAGINIFWMSSEKATRLSVRNAMEIVKTHDIKSVAFPLIGCGANKLDENIAINIIEEEVSRFDLDIKVIIVQY